ncbi:hypothetical protein BDV95DRAFT_591161 [Massariosphaeria phaeospora]|uniref:Uncharacterized protein n=1 Tax=Massariosphaeria phaeospora TaxID=100035 RepID=A0A7C8IBT0_9PLEO|nr:hypothetical protein BDV95DRAFT_591161 [Massariosphaeria phaeospora]
MDDTTTPNAAPHSPPPQPPLNSPPVSTNMDANRPTTAAPPAQPSSSPPPKPRGHIVFTAHFADDRRLRLYINTVQEQEIRNARDCISYTIEAEANQPQKSTRRTPPHITEKHGWFLHVGAFQEICEEVRIVSPKDEDQHGPPIPQEDKDEAAFKAWRKEVLMQLEQHHNDSWTPISAPDSN